MQSIILKTVVDEKRRIMIDLPEDVPIGEVEIEVSIYSRPDDQTGSREWVQMRLRELGLLAEADDDLADAAELSEEEEERLSRQLAGVRSSLDLINEDREERF